MRVHRVALTMALAVVSWGPLGIAEAQGQEPASAPLLVELHNAGAFHGGELVEFAGHGHEVPLHIPVISWKPVTDAGPLLRHVGAGPIDGRPFAGIPIGTEMSVWHDLDGRFHEAGQVVVREGIALRHSGPMGDHTEWIYSVEAVEGTDPEDLDAPPEVGRIWIAPSRGGPPHRREGRPPFTEALETEWNRVLEIRDTDQVGVPQQPPDAPWVEDGRHARWLTFDGPEGRAMFVGRVLLLDSGSEMQMNHLFWLVDEEGTVWFEMISNFLDHGSPPEPELTQDLNGNGWEEVHALSMVIRWTGDEWVGVPDRP